MPRRLVTACAAALALPAAHALSVEPVTLDRVLEPALIGAEVPWFEAVVGPAFRVEDTRRTYRIPGCEFAVTAEGGKISGFEIPVTPECAFDLARFMPNADGLPALGDLTFETFDAAVAGQVRYQADCLKLCGNAYDPSVYAAWEGARADNMMTVTLGKRLIDDVSIDAADAWEKAMAGEGDDYVVDTRFNCDGKYDEAARAALKAVKPDRIFIGAATATTGATCLSAD